MSIVNIEKYQEKHSFLVITSQGVNVLKVDVIQPTAFKVLEKCTKNLIGHSILAFNNHESNIDC